MSKHSPSHFSEWQFAIAVKKVGLIKVDQLSNTAEPVLLVFGIFGKPREVVGSGRFMVKILVFGICSIVRNSFHWSGRI